MSEVFIKVVNMSITASWIVLAVLVLRLLLKKAPKWMTLLLWGIVAIRLICPVTIESVLSLIPSAETISPGIMMDRTPGVNSGYVIINRSVNAAARVLFATDPLASANPLQIWIPVAALVWLAGIAGMLIYTVISYFRVKRSVRTAVQLRDNIFQSEKVVSPFVLGVVKPRIYLPFYMNAQDMSHVIAHEQAHICRKDHLWKPLGFFLLTLHWFNPLMWLGYVLLCRDIEFACDEKVVEALSAQQKADYSQALLNCSVNRRGISACPLAFGEVGVKNRVKFVLRYRKPALWMAAVGVAVCIAAAVCFLTSPSTDHLQYASRVYTDEEIEAAIVEARVAFAENFDACYLQEITYLGDDALEDYREFADRSNADDVLVLTSAFYVPPTGAHGSLNADSTYEDFKFIMVRAGNSKWFVEDYGYP